MAVISRAIVAKQKPAARKRFGKSYAIIIRTIEVVVSSRLTRPFVSLFSFVSFIIITVFFFVNNNRPPMYYLFDGIITARTIM